MGSDSLINRNSWPPSFLLLAIAGAQARRSVKNDTVYTANAQVHFSVTVFNTVTKIAKEQIIFEKQKSTEKIISNSQIKPIHCRTHRLRPLSPLSFRRQISQTLTYMFTITIPFRVLFFLLGLLYTLD